MDSVKGEKMSQGPVVLTKYFLHLATTISPQKSHMLRSGQDGILKPSTLTDDIECVLRFLMLSSLSFVIIIVDGRNWSLLWVFCSIPRDSRVVLSRD